jgi:hypothetical protein
MNNLCILLYLQMMYLQDHFVLFIKLTWITYIWCTNNRIKIILTYDAMLLQLLCSDLSREMLHVFLCENKWYTYKF